MTKKKNYRVLSFVCILTMLLPILVPGSITYASIVQEQQFSQVNSANADVYNSDELQSDGSVNTEGCILDNDDLTVFDTWKQNMSTASQVVENAPSEKQVVNEVVIFIRFAGQEETTYEERGGYDYIESLFNGDTKSLKDYVDEYSWGQVDANTYFWPQNADGTPKCYVDEHSVNYYLKQSTSNPEGYTAAEKSSRRQALLKNAIKFAGEDFLEQIGIADENTLAYKIPVEGQTNQYFMIEYRGNSSSGYDTALNKEGLIFYRVQSNKSGNGYGPPDEVYVLREEGKTVAQSYYNGEEGKSSFSGFTLYDDATDLGISVFNIKKEDGKMSFDIEVPYMGLDASKKSPITVADSTELVLSTSSLGDNYTYRFGVIANNVEYELFGGYQSKSSVNVNLVEALKSKTVGIHTLYVDVKNGTTGKVKRGTISDYEVKGVNVSEITTNLASPQKVGNTIKLSATLENETVSEKNIYQFSVENNGIKEVLAMDSNYTASWTQKEAGIYTIKYTITDAYGVTVSKELQYPIGTDTTAYVFYKNSSWSKAYIRVQPIYIIELAMENGQKFQV